MNPWRGLSGLPRPVWILAAVAFTNRVGAMFVPFLVLYATGALGVSPSKAGVLLTVYGVGGIIAAPIGGRLCDRFGPVRVMWLSLVAAGALLLAMPLATTYEATLALVALLALVGEAVRPATMSATGAFAGASQRRAAFALTRLAVNLGMAVGPALGGVLALHSFSLLCIVDGATSLAAALLLTLAWPGEPPAVAREPEHLRKGAWRAPGFMVFLLGALACAIVFFQHESTLPLYLTRELALPSTTFGLMFTINTGLIVLVEVPINLAMARWPHRRVLALGALLNAIGFGSAVLVTPAWGGAAAYGMALTVVVWTFGEMVLLPGMTAYVTDIAPPGRAGEFLGLYSMTWGVAFATGPVAGTWLYDHVGPAAVWLACFGLGSCAALVFATRLREPAPAPPPDEPSLPTRAEG
jgi:MFS family permease